MALPVDRDDLLRAVDERAGAGGPLDRLVAALAVQSELAALGAEVVQGVVAEARASGASWSRIGEALGVTKQAAQQRFAARGDTQRGAPPDPLEAVLAAAAAAVRGDGRRRIDPADLAASLLPGPDGPTSLGGAALAALGIDVAAARERLRTDRGEGGARPVRGRIGRSDATSAVLARAGAAAADRGAATADSGDLLEAVVEALADAGGGLGVAPGEVRDEVARLRRLGLCDPGA